MNEKIQRLAIDLQNFNTDFPHEDFQAAIDEFAKQIIHECHEALWTTECNFSDVAYENYATLRRKIRSVFGLVS